MGVAKIPYIAFALSTFLTFYNKSFVPAKYNVAIANDIFWFLMCVYLMIMGENNRHHTLLVFIVICLAWVLLTSVVDMHARVHSMNPICKINLIDREEIPEGAKYIFSTSKYHVFMNGSTKILIPVSATDSIIVSGEKRKQ